MHFDLLTFSESLFTFNHTLIFSNLALISLKLLDCVLKNPSELDQVGSSAYRSSSKCLVTCTI